jgi:hypothetical protein
MSPTVAIAIVVVAVIGIIILRSARRRKMATYFPSVTYVDETLLDLVRTRQIGPATKYYQKHASTSAEEAEQVIEYLVRHPESLMLMVRLQGKDQTPLYMDDTLLELLKAGRDLKATTYYADKTSGDIREAQIAVGALITNPEMKFKNRV